MFLANRTLAIVLGVTVACVALCNVVELRAELKKQPSNKKSTLVDYHDKSITDAEFAVWIRDLLQPGGSNNVLDAKFIFQECYSGGMLDDLVENLEVVKWVGGSASRHDEYAIGQVSTAENDRRPEGQKYDVKWVADPPQCWYTKELKTEMAEDQTLLTGIDNAAASDGANSQGEGTLEHGQSTYENGGDQIRLDDVGAVSCQHESDSFKAKINGHSEV